MVFSDFSDSEMNLRDDKFEKAKTSLLETQKIRFAVNKISENKQKPIENKV